MTVLESETWMEDAVCTQIDPEIFFPEKNGTSWEAKRICKLCPVKAACCAYAIKHDERFGVWGGMSAWERARIKRSRRLRLV